MGSDWSLASVHVMGTIPLVNTGEGLVFNPYPVNCNYCALMMFAWNWHRNLHEHLCMTGSAAVNE